MKKKLLIGFILFLILWLNVSITIAQRDIEPNQIFYDTVSYNFSGEWQYLSTDIYLFNAEKFSTLINELEFVRQGSKQSGGIFKKKTALSEEFLEYLFITVRLKNVKFFGDNDITYPLYNFQISRDKEDKYRTFVSDNIDYVRLIDNLPLYTASDFIDAEIKVKAISNNDRDQILGLVASQLKALSKIQTPTNAVLGIIGEFGNFIESNTKKKEYRFSSTIRLFEQKNFDKRLHSLRIYALVTSNSKPVLVETSPIKALLDTSANPEINRQLLVSLLNYQTYPLLVVANYKSLYKMEQVTGDEINFTNIEKRKLKIENDYRAGLINVETYRLERDFINFITIFANLKNHLEVYCLNYRTGNTDAIAGGLFKLTQYYRQLIKAYDEIQFKYSGNNSFQSVFKKEYESIIGYASLYLDEDHNLKSVKSLVQTLLDIEKRKEYKSETELESAITSLRFAEVFKPHYTDQTIEGQMIKINVDRLEQELYAKTFEKLIAKLDNTIPNSTNKNAPDELRHLLRTTSCALCRTKGYEAINNFLLLYEEFERKQALSRLDSIISNLQPWVYERLQRLQLAREKLDSFYSINRESETKNYIAGKLSEVERDLKNLQDYSRIDVLHREYAIIESLSKKILSTQDQADKTFNLLYGLKPELFSQSLGNEKQIVDEPKDVSGSFSADDPAVRQNDIFIAIFESQLSNIVQKISSSQNQSLLERVKAVQSLLEQLKVSNDLYSQSLNEPQKSKRIGNEISALLKEVSDMLSQLEENVIG